MVASLCAQLGSDLAHERLEALVAQDHRVAAPPQDGDGLVGRKPLLAEHQGRDEPRAVEPHVAGDEHALTASQSVGHCGNDSEDLAQRLRLFLPVPLPVVEAQPDDALIARASDRLRLHGAVNVKLGLKSHLGGAAFAALPERAGQDLGQRRGRWSYLLARHV